MLAYLLLASDIPMDAFTHNDWVDLNAPMISVFEDRIEILSYGGLPAKQTITGFFAGKSKPRCIELAEIFLQLSKTFPIDGTI